MRCLGGAREQPMSRIDYYARHDFDSFEQTRGMFHVSFAEAIELNRDGFGIFAAVNNFATPGVRRMTNLDSIAAWVIDID